MKHTKNSQHSKSKREYQECGEHAFKKNPSEDLSPQNFPNERRRKTPIWAPSGGPGLLLEKVLDLVHLLLKQGIKLSLLAFKLLFELHLE